MPGETGVTVVTMLVCFVLFRTRGCGCIERPAFPAPSVFSGRMILQNSGTLRREIAESYLDLTSLRGAKRRSNPFFLCGPMDCFACARNDGLNTRHTFNRHLPRRRAKQYSRDASDGISATNSAAAD